MKKNIIMFIMVAVLFSLNSIAIGQQHKEITLEEMQVPNSPAFILLDVSPVSIEKPSSPKAFVANIVNTVNAGNGIPKNYAVEFTPYWFFKHPNLSALNYWGIDPETKTQLPFSSIGLFSVSLAFVSQDVDTLSVTGSTNLAMGLRTTIFKLYGESEKEKLLNANSLLVARMAEWNTKIIDVADDPKKLKEVLDSIQNDKEMVKQEDFIRSVIANKPIFDIEGAIASNIAFQNEDFNSNRLARFGSWLNLAYAHSFDDALQKKNYLNMLMTLRYLQNKDKKDNLNNFILQNFFDTGGRIEFEFERISFSYEYISRHSFDDDTQNSFRSSGSLKYKINSDFYLTAAFGKNFGDTKNLISQFGINWSIGTGNEKVQQK